MNLSLTASLLLMRPSEAPCSESVGFPVPVPQIIIRINPSNCLLPLQTRETCKFTIPMCGQCQARPSVRVFHNASGVKALFRCQAATEGFQVFCASKECIIALGNKMKT